MHVLLRYGMYFDIHNMYSTSHRTCPFLFSMLFQSYNISLISLFTSFQQNLSNIRSLRLIIPSDTSHEKKGLIPPMTRQTHHQGKRQKYFPAKKSSLELLGAIMHVANCSPTSTTRHSVWAFQRTKGRRWRWRMSNEKF